MGVFTVFFCGTCSNKFDSTNPLYPNGEIVSTLADNHSGSEFVDWIVVDGPGSGNLQDDEKWTKPTTAWESTQKAWGTGWEENVTHAIGVLKCEYEWKRAKITADQLKKLKSMGVDVEAKESGSWYWRQVELPDRKVTPQDLQCQKAKIFRKGQLPTAVNMIGWSRGGVTCTMLANAMAKDSKLAGIPVNIFAVDPVPGTGNFQAHRTVLPANVKNYVAVYARDERSKGFAPIIPKSNGAKPRILPFPGRHGTLAGNNSIDGDKGSQVLAASGKVVRHLAETYLKSWGTNLGKTLNLSNSDLLKLYDQMIADDQKYVAMRTKVYTMAENSNGHRSVCVGEKGDWAALPDVKGDKYADPVGLSVPEAPKKKDEERDDVPKTLINWHHLSLVH